MTTTANAKRGKEFTSKVIDDQIIADPNVPFSTKKRAILSSLIDQDNMEDLLRKMQDHLDWYASGRLGAKIQGFVGPRSMHAIISASLPGKTVGVIAGNSALMESSGHVEPLGDL